MSQVDFTKIINERNRKTVETLSVKAKEYVRNNNPFHNFDVASRISGEPSAKCLHNFMMKHFVSYLDMLDDIERGEQIPEKLIDEKLGDLITYLHIQEALIKMRHGKKV